MSKSINLARVKAAPRNHMELGVVEHPKKRGSNHKRCWVLVCPVQGTRTCPVGCGSPRRPMVSQRMSCGRVEARGGRQQLSIPAHPSRAPSLPEVVHS